MEYCPYCSAPLSKEYKTCPECKKSLDINILQSMYTSGETSEIDHKAKRKIWYKEHAHIFMPIITLIIGLLAGSIASYSGALVQFSNERTGFLDKIESLEKQIESGASETAGIRDTLEAQINARDEVIQILEEQQNIMSRIINFTRRAAGNSTIAVNTEEERSFYDRNVRYLIRLYNDQVELLQATGHEPIPSYNLETLPQLITE